VLAITRLETRSVAGVKPREIEGVVRRHEGQ
jgi:hypothetical protein